MSYSWVELLNILVGITLKLTPHEYKIYEVIETGIESAEVLNLSNIELLFVL